MIDLIKFKIKEGFEGEAIALFEEQLKHTRNEKGCLMDNVFQLKSEPTVFYLLIKWEDEESLRKHMEQPYDLEFREKMDRILAAPVEPIDWQQIL